MSSVYPPPGSAPARPCQRCGISFPISEVFCKNCGYQNAPVPNNFPQIPFPQQPDMRNGYAPPAQPMGNGSFYGPYGQPPLPNNNYGPFTGQIGQQPAFPQQSFQAGPSAPNMANRPPQAGEWHVPQTPSLSQPRRPTIGRIISVLLILVALVGGGTFGVILLTKNDQPAATKTTVAPVSTPKLPPIFTDPFKDNSNNWNLQAVPGKSSVSIANSALTLEDGNHDMLWEPLPGNKSYGDFKLFVDATLSKGDQNNGYGFFVRSALQGSELASYYRFSLYGDGTFAIFKGAVDANGQSSSKQLTDYTASDVIQKSGAVNHLALLANGSSMTFQANGQTLATINDNSYPSGNIAFFVINLKEAQGSAQAQFSNFSLYPPHA